MSVDFEAERTGEHVEGLRFSVVIPVHNRPDILRRAVESVVAQTWPPKEVIVVDDGSDPPVEAAGLAPEPGGPPVMIVRHGVSLGAARARNAGVAVADGTYVAFLDSDDMWRPTYLEQVARAIQMAPTPPVAVTTGLYWCDDRLRPYRRQRPTHAATFENLVKHGNFLGGCSVITVQKAAFQQIGGFQPIRGADDWNLLLDLVRTGRIDTVPDALVLYRSPSAVSSSTETMTGQYARQILAVKSTFRRLGLQHHASARRIRRFNAVSDLGRAGRWRRCLRCVGYALKAEKRVSPYMVRALIYLVLGPRLRMALERRLTVFRAGLYRPR